MRTLAGGLYLGPEERELVEKLAIDTQRGRSFQSKQHIVVSNSSEGSSSSFMAPVRVENNVAMRLKDAEAKCFEDTSE